MKEQCLKHAEFTIETEKNYKQLEQDHLFRAQKQWGQAGLISGFHAHFYKPVSCKTG